MKDIKNLILGAGLVTVMLSACENSNLTQSGLNPADFDSTVLGKKRSEEHTSELQSR